ncbi:MAG TPA: hypothetical protein VE546_13435 [Streptomyces sp.]|uniref:hypothetical protein n=1 Tax=Streptomyces sp. TaxID=1931 RepID=UPI002D333326|nr:hypothetical protein [Streptomyces sp.]HZG04553.1 hypothetical protein [Streptomyces sp.]
MNHDTPLSPRPVRHLSHVRRRVVTARTLREHGVPAATADERCRPGGPWQMPLPGVYLLHPGPPTGEERLHAVLLYAGLGRASDRVPGRVPDAVITGPAALALHGFSSAPSLTSLDLVDVLVPRSRRLRSAGWARVVRTRTLPRPEEVTGLPVAPVPRALADTIGRTTDAAAVRRLLTEAVRDGHCEVRAVVRELTRARLLDRPHVVDAVEVLSAEGRAAAEGLLYGLVRAHGLPDPCWNVDLGLPGGSHLGGVDAYWPEQAVAVEIDTRAPHEAPGGDGAAAGGADGGAVWSGWSGYVRKRETLGRLGIAVLHLTPAGLRDRPERQAAVIRTALMTAPEREPAVHVTVLPR